MTKEQIQKATVTFVVFLLAVSAIGYLIFPSAMLSVVGIKSDPQADFLIRTLAAALAALIPSAWSARQRENPTLYQSVMLGLAIYMFLSSAVDYDAYLTRLVNGASIPSIFFRIVLGGVLLWIMRRDRM